MDRRLNPFSMDLPGIDQTEKKCQPKSLSRLDAKASLQPNSSLISLRRVLPAITTDPFDLFLSEKLWRRRRPSVYGMHYLYRYFSQDDNVAIEISTSIYTLAIYLSEIGNKKKISHKNCKGRRKQHPTNHPGRQHSTTVVVCSQTRTQDFQDGEG